TTSSPFIVPKISIPRSDLVPFLIVPLNMDERAFPPAKFILLFIRMSTVQEIEAMIPRLTRAQVEELRDWIEDYLESQLELTDEVKAKLDQSRHEVAGGQFTEIVS
ncbi:MAG: hypothetical protein JWM16_1286, partial [Verrucomicrobiales bacterium]|nr:hypothetical protein [Verrucomicrobiales bacterium]